MENYKLQKECLNNELVRWINEFINSKNIGDISSYLLSGIFVAEDKSGIFQVFKCLACVDVPRFIYNTCILTASVGVFFNLLLSTFIVAPLVAPVEEFLWIITYCKFNIYCKHSIVCILSSNVYPLWHTNDQN